MNPLHHLPPEQRPTQRLVDQFNADERLWDEVRVSRPIAPHRLARMATDGVNWER